MSFEGKKLSDSHVLSHMLPSSYNYFDMESPQIFISGQQMLYFIKLRISALDCIKGTRCGCSDVRITKTKSLMHHRYQISTNNTAACGSRFQGALALTLNEALTAAEEEDGKYIECTEKEDGEEEEEEEEEVEEEETG
ncbi:hypothetical protein CAPTEDRAFT_198069 [Capitella teleta]|uniref:Uncharacterized protein n=1 Tax=Capitella teleta TaxID=283909 RepID=X1ZY96_CAPTE|nr:hypothetical protein CAPTEDRAFT_198069 [Capitella teleta]|eukprot:ELU04622.1 hypothetical protein CAPTEDRAFT_198069 [Capitella teleta]